MRWTVTLALWLTILPLNVFAEGKWLKGDLHSHSHYSDGSSSVVEVLRSAEDAGLDFFVLTDHDSKMGGAPSYWADPEYRSSKMVLLYGVEWTTRRGHANIWSDHPIDYDGIWRANRSRDAESAKTLAEEQGALFSINHPKAKFAARWRLPVSNLKSVEVWNAMYRFPSFNVWAVNTFWDGMLKEGQRVTAVGGSDSHAVHGGLAYLYGQGNPTTWVYAEDATPQAVLKAIENGRVSMSYSPKAARVEISADADNDGKFELMQGDGAVGVTGNVKFQIKIVRPDQSRSTVFSEPREVPSETVEALDSGALTLDEFLPKRQDGKGKVEIYHSVGVVKNGKLFKVWKIRGNVMPIVFEDEINSEQKNYYRVELIGRPDVSTMKRLLYGRMISLSNPIYFGF